MKTSTTSIIRGKVYKELQYDALSAIVTEALVRATPLNKQELATHANNLKDYVRETLVGMNAVAMVEEAYQNPDLEIAKRAYLYNLHDAITEVPLEAANRIANENVNTSSVAQCIGDRAFTKEELSRLQKKGENLTLNEVSRVINKKVTGVLKDERNAYEKEQILQHELAQIVRQHTEEVHDTLTALDAPEEDDDSLETVTDNANTNAEDDMADVASELNDVSDDEEDSDLDDLDDPSLDSFLNMALNKNDPRGHISVFSKLQDLAIESIMTGGYPSEELSMGVLRDMTQKSVLPMPNIAEESVDQIVDRLTIAMETTVPTAINEDTMQSALTCAILVYTLLETLKTMNICSPDLNSVKSFVGSTPKVSTPQDVSNTLQERLVQQVSSIRDKIPHMNQGQLGIAFDSCTDMQNQVNKLAPKYPDLKNKVGPVLETVMSTLQARINEFNKKPAEESVFVKKIRGENAAQFSRLANLYGARTDIREIKINVDPADEGTYVGIEVRDANGCTMFDTGVSLNRNRIPGNMLEIVTECVGASRLMNTYPAVSIYNTATCRSTPIKPYTY